MGQVVIEPIESLGEETLGAEEVDDAQWWQVGEQMRSIRAMLDELQRAIRTDAAFARVRGRDVAASEQKYGELLSNYQRLRVAIGLPAASGLGAIPTAGWVAIAFAALTTGVWAFGTQVRGFVNEWRASSAGQEAVQAAARGDTSRAQALLQQQRLLAPAGLENWLTNNWLWLAGGLGVLLFARR